MAKRNYTAEQIISKLREVEVKVSQGIKAAEAIRSIGVSEQTYYRWRKEYGGMRTDQAKRMKEVEKENIRLKKLVAELSLDNAILKEVSRGNF
jgi:transposase-like protein